MTGLAKGGYRKGWTRWETSLAVPWAGEPKPWDDWHVVENTPFFFRELDALASAVVEGGPSPISLEHAWNVASAMESAFISSEEGRTRVQVKNRL